MLNAGCSKSARTGLRMLTDKHEEGRRKLVTDHFVLMRCRGARASCCKLTCKMKPASTWIPSGVWWNGATWHPQGRSAPSVFWDEKGVSPVKWLPKGTAANSDRCSWSSPSSCPSHKKSCRSIARPWPWQAAHKSAHRWITQFVCTLLQQRPCSTDLAAVRFSPVWSFETQSARTQLRRSSGKCCVPVAAERLWEGRKNTRPCSKVEEEEEEEEDCWEKLTLCLKNNYTFNSVFWSCVQF